MPTLVRRVLIGLAVVLMAGSATATTITSTVGDLDCFGLGGTCADGDLWSTGLGGVFFTDYRTPADVVAAPHTDIWAAPGSASWTHTYTLTGAPVAASFGFRIAGFADIGLASLFIDGVLAATYDFADQFQTVHFLTVPVPLAAIDGSTSFSLTTEAGGDGWSMDSSTLTVEVPDQVPEPTTLALLGAGLVALRARRRRTS